MKKTLIIGLALLMFAAFSSYGQNVTASAFSQYDTACPIAIKYVGTGTNLVKCTTAQVACYADDIAYSQLLNATTNIADVVGFLNSCTNTDGERVFKAVCWEALTTDTLTNKIVPFTNSIGTTWDTTAFKWDTSVALTYDLVPDTLNGNGKAIGGFLLKEIYGDAAGTGNVTVNVYENDTMLYQRSVLSPVYVFGSTVTSDTATATSADNTIMLESMKCPNIWVGAGQKCLIRATRATTATTGGIGASISGTR